MIYSEVNNSTVENLEALWILDYKRSAPFYFKFNLEYLNQNISTPKSAIA
jgi:hypothetical protein